MILLIWTIEERMFVLVVKSGIFYIFGGELEIKLLYFEILFCYIYIVIRNI